VNGSVSFDRAVEYYDRTRGISEEASRRQTSLLAAELQGRCPCLEIGVGTGLVALPLAEAGIDMVGLDVSGPMLAKLVEKAGGTAFPLVIADATSIPFGGDRFGSAVLRHVLHLIPTWERAVEELVRVVRRGGIVLLSRGDIPGAWREITDRFLQLVGAPSFAPAFRAWDQAAVDAVFERLGAGARSLPPIEDRSDRSIGSFLDQMADGLHSWTWEVDEPDRRNAVEEVRRWAIERYGSLDPPGSREIVIRWRAYDLP
jgi:ubiquinone/menaquinone biosynthesis C-methylase UbiE